MKIGKNAFVPGLLLLCLPGVARAQTLGTKPAGIVNGKGQVVGGGKSLTVVGATEKTPSADAKQRYLDSVSFLNTYLNSLNALNADTVKVKMALHTNATELKELREYLADLQRSRDKATSGGALWKYCDDLIKQKQDDIRALQTEQDDMIARIGKRWDEMAENLQTKIGETGEFVEFQKGLKGLQSSIVQKRQLADMEVLLSAGRSEDFRRLAVQADQNPALRMPVLLMKVADYMERGEGRLALYAARLGADTYPDNPAFQSLQQGMSVSYLKMIAAKASGDRAEVHHAWESYNGKDSDGYLKQIISGSPRHALDILTGKEFELEQVQKNAMAQGVAEQNGIELMWRLQEKGLSLKNIKALSAEELHQQLNQTFNPKTPYEYIDVIPLHRSLQAAFGNADVKRLLSGSKQEFDTTSGHSYYGAQDFDTGFLEWAADAVTVKNALLFCGPTAVVQYGQEAGMLSRLSRLGVSSNSISTAFEGTQTVRDALLAMPKLQQIGQYVGTTRTGASLLRVMETARYLRYDANPAVKFTTFVTENLAQMFLFQAGGKIGHALGGELGGFMGEAMVALAGNPLADMQGLNVKEGQALEAYAATMAQTRAKWEATNTLLKDIRLPLRGSVQRLATAEIRSAQAVQELEQFIARAEQASAQARAAAAEQSSPLLQATADEAEALRNAALAAKQGEIDAAQVALDAAAKLESEAVTAAIDVEKVRSNTSVVGKEALNKNGGTSVVPLSEGTRGAVHLEEAGAGTKAELTGIFPLNNPPAPGPKPKPDPIPSSAVEKSAQELGDSAMRTGQFEDAKAYYKTGFQKTIDDLRNPNLGADERSKLVEELTLMRDRVREARQAAKFEAGKASMPKAAMEEAVANADKALKPFTPEEIKKLESVRKLDTEEVTGTTGGPRKVFDKDTGELLGYWKPAAVKRHLGTLPETGQMFSEILMSRIGRKLGLNIAEAIPLTLEGEAGVFIRNIAGTRQLMDLSEGARLALKGQIAKFRAAQVLLGNYDIHMGNYLVDDAGRVWAIDAGMAQITSPSMKAFTDMGKGKSLVDYHADMPNFKPSGDDALDWARLWRDWYSHRGGHPEIEATSKTVARLDALIKGSDMRQTAQQIKNFSDDELQTLIKQVMGTHPEAKDALETLRKRRDLLQTLLNEKWPGALGPAVSQLPTHRVSSKEVGSWLIK